MGMSSYVVGIVPPDEKFKEMKAIHDLCIKGNVPVPREVWDFFEGDSPDGSGVIVRIDGATTEYNADMQDGFEVDISKLDPKIKIIRFTNSY